MKNLINILIYSFFIFLIACVGETPMEKNEKILEAAKYKKGDIVCVVEFNVKGIVQYVNGNYHVGEPVYSVMFNDKNDQLYNLNIYESQLTECH